VEMVNQVNTHRERDGREPTAMALQFWLGTIFPF
jgi:hypothetical protein